MNYDIQFIEIGQLDFEIPTILGGACTVMIILISTPKIVDISKSN